MPTRKQQEYLFTRIGYKPSPEQWAVHLCPNRVRLVAGGERSGKSYSSAMDLVSRMFEGSLFWLVAADYVRTRAEFDYIQMALVKLGVKFEATKQVDPGEIYCPELNIRFVTKSAKDPRTLASTAPDGILVCEASQIDYESFQRLRGRLAEKRGWMLMSGTFESSLGWYVSLYNRGKGQNKEGLVSFSLPTWSNLAVFPGGREDPEIKALEAQFTTEWFLERFGGIPCPPKGLVFPEFTVDIHTGTGEAFKYDKKNPVYIWVDPGYDHAYAVLAAQRRGDQVVVFDEVYERGFTTQDILTICQQRPWWHLVKGGAIDVGGRQHHGMTSPEEVWLKQGGVVLRAQHIRIVDGIERVKASLKVNPLTGQPQLLVNSKCRGLISELGGCPNPLNDQIRVYQWRMDSSGMVVGDVPEDKNNDAVKALTYGLVDMIGFTPKARARVKSFKIR